MTKTFGWSSLAVLCLLLLAFHLRADPGPNVEISGYTLLRVVSENGEFRFDYKARALNRGASTERAGLIATLKSPSSNRFRIGDASLHFPPVQAGRAVRSIDPFSVVRNVSKPLTPGQLAQLRWRVERNRVPVANAGPDQTVALGQTIALDGSGSSDADGDRLRFEWRLVLRPTGSRAALSDRHTVRPTFTADVAGRYRIRLRVSDRKVESRVKDAVLVTTGNVAPVAAAGPDQTARVGGTVGLDGGGSSDANGDPLTFRWSLEAPQGSAARLSDPNTVAPRFVVDKPGTYRATLIVSDGTLDSGPDQAVISIENSQPVANAGQDRTAPVGDTVQLDGSGSQDPDGDPLSFRWAIMAKPEGSTASLSDPSAEKPTFIGDVAGLYVLQLIVSDGRIDSEPDTVTVTVNAVPVNRPPQITSSPVTTATVGTP